MRKILLMRVPLQQQAITYTLFILVLFLVACGTESTMDSVLIERSFDGKSIETNLNSPMTERDSKILERSFIKNLIVAMKNIGKNEFNLKVEERDSMRNEVVISELIFGSLFASKQRHLITRRHFEYGCFLDVFVYEDDSFRLLLTHVQDDLTFINDTIFDANGDGLKDYVVCWYPSSGCCPRKIQSVYLLQQDKISFSKEIEFMNATFSQKEQIVRGLEYGHPEEIGLYKFRWNLNRVDTIEYIYHNKKVKGEFIKVKYSGRADQKMDSIELKSLPAEYKKIDNVDWFYVGD